MTALDWLIIAIFAVSVVLAAEQGLIFELVALGGVVVGYLAAAWNYQRLAPWFQSYVKSARVAELAGFLTIFFAVLLLAGIGGRIARWSVKQAGLHWFDRVLGGVFGVIRAAVIVAVLMLGITAFGPGAGAVNNSRLGSYFLVLARGVSWVAPSGVRQRLRDALEDLERKPSPKAAAATPKPAGGQPQRQ